MGESHPLAHRIRVVFDAHGVRNRDQAAEEERGGGDGDETRPDLVLALDGVRGLEDGPGRLLPEHVAPSRAPAGGGGGCVDAVGGVGLAMPELGQRQRRRGAREARDVGGQVAQQRRPGSTGRSSSDVSFAILVGSSSGPVEEPRRRRRYRGRRERGRIWVGSSRSCLGGRDGSRRAHAPSPP